MEYRLHRINISLQEQVCELLSRLQSDIVTLQLLYGPFFFRGVRLPICAYFVRVPVPFINILLPGAILGAYSNDYIGPRLTMAVGFTLQGIIGLAFAGAYSTIKENIAGFVVMYGIFQSLGEFGPGGTTIVLSSKTCAAPIRGQYFGIAAGVGKLGAFAGTYVFPIIKRKYGEQTPFWVSSVFALFGASLALFLLPEVGPDANLKENAAFLEYLTSIGFDTSKLGDADHEEDKPSIYSEVTKIEDKDDKDSHLISISVK